MKSDRVKRYPKPPCECGGRTVLKLTAKKFKVDGETIVADKVPSYVCEDCGEVYFNVCELADIEKRLEKGKIPAYV